MITYDTHRGLAFACTLRGSAFPRAFRVGAPAAGLAVGLHVAFNHLDLPKSSGAGDVGASILSGFTFILGFLIVFRSQQAYSRWWEGGTLMQQLRGEWFNAVSSCIAFCTTAKDKEEDVWKFEQTLVRLISLLYCSALVSVSSIDPASFEHIELEGIAIDSLDFMDSAHDRSEILLQWIQRLIVEATEAGIIGVSPPVLSRVYNQLGNGIVILSNARKIKDFPFPFPLAQMITIMLVAHWNLTAFVVATSVEQASWAGFIAFAVTFSFWSVHYIGEELEQPFGDDPNDLPIASMQADLNASLKDLLNPLARFPPKYQYQTWGDHSFEVRDGDVSMAVRRMRDAPRGADRRVSKFDAFRAKAGTMHFGSDSSAPPPKDIEAQAESSTWKPPAAGPEARRLPPPLSPLAGGGEMSARSDGIGVSAGSGSNAALAALAGVEASMRSNPSSPSKLAESKDIEKADDWQSRSEVSRPIAAAAAVLAPDPAPGPESDLLKAINDETVVLWTPSNTEVSPRRIDSAPRAPIAQSAPGRPLSQNPVLRALQSSPSGAGVVSGL